jgi:hypothetical protein
MKLRENAAQINMMRNQVKLRIPTVKAKGMEETKARI